MSIDMNDDEIEACCASAFWNRVDKELDFLAINKKQLAADCKLNYGTMVNQYSLGKLPDIEAACKIAGRLNLSIGYLVLGLKNSNETITSREKDLITLFRSLSEEKQDKLIDFLKIFM